MALERGEGGGLASTPSYTIASLRQAIKQAMPTRPAGARFVNVEASILTMLLDDSERLREAESLSTVSSVTAVRVLVLNARAVVKYFASMRLPGCTSPRSRASLERNPPGRCWFRLMLRPTSLLGSRRATTLLSVRWPRSSTPTL